MQIENYFTFIVIAFELELNAFLEALTKNPLLETIFN